MDKAYKRPAIALSLLLIASLLVAACGSAATAIPSPTPAAGTTATPVASQPSATTSPLPTATQAPQPAATPTTASPAPTQPAPTPTPERISFAPGTTSATIEGTMPASRVRTYVLGVNKDQLLDVVLSPSEGIDLSVEGMDGTVLQSAANGESAFRGTVPTTQEYILGLNAESGVVSYTMDVIVPLQISFAPGTTSAQVQGDLAANGVQYYAVQAAAGQLMEVSILPQSDVRLSIYGADGTALATGESSDAFFRGILPSTQDYILALAAAPGPVSYTMSVIIPVRISFAPGATSAVLQGNLAAHSVQYYILGANAGQQMEISISPENSVELSIYGVDGEVLKSGMGGGSSFQGPIPITEDYIVALGTGDQPVAYTMQVRIP